MPALCRMVFGSRSNAVRQGPSPWRPEINKTHMSSPEFTAVAAGLGQFLVSLFMPPFLCQPRELRKKSGWEITTGLTYNMLCYRGGSESKPRTFGLVHFIQGIPHSLHFTPTQIIPPEGHVWQWAGAAILDFRGHAHCSRQRCTPPKISTS